VPVVPLRVSPLIVGDRSSSSPRALAQDRSGAGQEARATVIHAGPECGTIGSTVPRLDMGSIDPTLADVHSPAERLKVASVLKLMDLLVETLRRIPEK
jgi:di/tripeptidase